MRISGWGFTPNEFRRNEVGRKTSVAKFTETDIVSVSHSTDTEGLLKLTGFPQSEPELITVIQAQLTEFPVLGKTVFNSLTCEMHFVNRGKKPHKVPNLDVILIPHVNSTVRNNLIVSVDPSESLSRQKRHFRTL